MSLYKGLPKLIMINLQWSDHYSFDHYGITLGTYKSSRGGFYSNKFSKWDRIRNLPQSSKFHLVIA